MHVEPLPGISLDFDGAAAVRDYVTAAGRLLDRFPHDPYAMAALRDRTHHLRVARSGPRAALSAALVAYNATIGADEAALAGARRLASADCLAVVTGQQAGACTGPLYTIYKAITAIHLAAEAAAALDTPVVPIFWVAGEDHDFAEIAPVEFPGRAGWERRVLRGDPAGRRSIAHLPVGPEVHALLDELAEALPDSEFRPGVLAGLRADAEAAPNLADWFARTMARLFAGTGLVFVNSADPALRRLESEFFQSALQHFEAVGEALAVGKAAWEAAGYPATVDVVPGSVGLFLYVDGERRALAGAGSHIWLRDEPGRGWDREELLALAARSPERFSTNVVLRSACQGFLLPDLAYVGGPGEIQYWGLYREVLAVLGQQLPVIYPRIGATLLEPPLARYVKKQGIPLADALLRTDALRSEILRREDPLGLDQLFSGFRRDLYGRYDQLVGTLLTLDQGLESVAAENRRRMDRQIEYLQDKAAQALRQRCEVALRQVDRLELSLRPGGRPQERAANIFYYLCKYGPDLVSRLIGALPLTQPWTHQVVYL